MNGAALWRRIKGWSAGEVTRPPLEDWDQFKSLSPSAAFDRQAF